MTHDFIAHHDWQTWIDDIPGEAPCGPNLEYDAQFRALDDAVRGRPEAQYGDTLVAAVPADWEAADALCAELMARTRDLRVIVWLTRARLVRDGVAGLADGLALIANLLERHWDHMHPQLDADDADPAARINALAALVEPGGMIAALLDCRLVSGGVPASVREWSYASGETSAPSGRDIVELREIEAALAASPDEAARSLDACEAALAHTQALERLLSARVGAHQSLDLDALKTPLRRAIALLRAQPGSSATTPARDTRRMPRAEAGASVNTIANAHPNAIESRADVAATLDALCAYYRAHEPASPVPLLLARARSLIDRTFVDLMKDLAPDGLAQLALVIGANTNADATGETAASE